MWLTVLTFDDQSGTFLPLPSLAAGGGQLSSQPSVSSTGNSNSKFANLKPNAQPFAPTGKHVTMTVPMLTGLQFSLEFLTMNQFSLWNLGMLSS